METTKRNNLTIEGIITLLSPLSHIGETRGTDSLLIRGNIIGSDNKRHETFRYNGNAFRGMLRDCGTLYLFEKLGNPKMPLDMLYLFASGGTIIGDQSVDLARAEQIRKTFQLLSIFGGGAKSQVLEGKMAIGFGVPLVRECQSILPERFRNIEAPPWRLWTEENFFTRTDDAKKEVFKKYLIEQTEPAQLTELPEPVSAQEEPQVDEQITDGLRFHKKYLEEKKQKQEKKQEQGQIPKSKDVPQQMRAMVESLCAGSKMYQRIDLFDVSDLELGAFVSCLDYFSRKPYIGGKASVGFGLCNIDYEYWNNGKLEHFMSIGENQTKICELGEGAKKAYDRWILDLYTKYLEENKVSMARLLEVK